MPKQTLKYYINEHQEELVSREHPGAPYLIHSDTRDTLCRPEFPWHWHPLLELAYLEDGALEYHLPENRLLLKKGEAIFINSNILHMVRPVDERSDFSVKVLLFDHHFLCGGPGSALEQKYFLPVLRCTSLPFLSFKPDTPSGVRALSSLLLALEKGSSSLPGCEFQVQNHLASLWMQLFTETESLRNNALPKNDASIERQKQMIRYIKEHYQEKLTVSDIAASASIGKRECLRCFQRNLSMSPIAYLNHIRVNAAAQMLISTSKPVQVISQECGFCSSSYFAQVFQKEMRCTPKEFQKQKEFPPSAC